MKKCFFIMVLVWGWLWIPGRTEATSFGHDRVDSFVQLSDSQITNARVKRVVLRRASVGGNISGGLNELADGDARLNRSNWNFVDRGNPGGEEKITEFVNYVDGGGAGEVLMMKFCFIDNTATDPISELANDYIVAMERLESRHPTKKFVYWTMPLQTSVDGRKNQFNSIVRNYASSNNKILYDIADIESSGAGRNDSNWQSSTEKMRSTISDDGGHLNGTGAVEAAKVFWVMMANIEGGGSVNPTPTVGASCRECTSGLPKNRGNTNCDSTINMLDFATWYAEYQTYRGSGNQLRNNWNSDFNCDQKVDMLDFATWYAGYVGGGT